MWTLTFAFIAWLDFKVICAKRGRFLFLVPTNNILRCSSQPLLAFVVLYHWYHHSPFKMTLSAFFNAKYMFFLVFFFSEIQMVISLLSIKIHTKNLHLYHYFEFSIPNTSLKWNQSNLLFVTFRVTSTNR